jgi:hypothetical protein
MTDYYNDTIFIDEIISPNGYMLSPLVSGCGLSYVFNQTANNWEEGTYGCDGVPTTTAEVDEFAPYTMAGLPIFYGAPRSFEYIVPLTKQRFINISFVEVGAVNIDTIPMVKTIEPYPAILTNTDQAKEEEAIQEESTYYKQFID